MPFVELPESPLAPGVSPVRIFYREHGAGVPLLFLHGGWGYEIYPFDHQIAELSSYFRILIPDRSGYGRSTRLTRFARPLHARGAAETLFVLGALGVERAVLWGHSDGAVMAANAALQAPERVTALVLEATHYDRAKPRSREFFSGLAADPDALGARVVERLKQEHGHDYWESLLKMEGEAWLAILNTAEAAEDDFFDGRLSEIRTPTLVLHGENDPRTEPGELDAMRELLPQARFHVLPGAGHSPHSEVGAASESTGAVREFLAAHRGC